MTNRAEEPKYQEVLVLVGAGAIGLTIARRQGAGKTVLLASIHEERLQADATALEADGYRVITQIVDVSSPNRCAHSRAAAGAGSVVQVVEPPGCRRCRHRHRPSWQWTSSARPFSSRSLAA